MLPGMYLAVAHVKGAASCPRDLRHWWEHTALGPWRQNKREQGVEHTAGAAGRQFAREPGQQHGACRECWCMGLEGKRDQPGQHGRSSTRRHLGCFCPKLMHLPPKAAPKQSALSAYAQSCGLCLLHIV